MTLTRNDSAVHEKTGRFDSISFHGNKGVVLNRDIDIRIFFDRWRSGFAVVEKVRSGTRHSLQFFGADGVAVHKVYLREDSDARAFESLVLDFMDTDQGPGQTVLRWTNSVGNRPDGEIDRAALRERWLALRDVHDFHNMLRAVGAGRTQAFRLVGEDCACRVAADSFQTALAKAAASVLPIMVFVGNPGTIQIHTGAVHRLKQTGPWYNVLDPGFNLHLRTDRIAGAWVVRKPTAEGIVTSLEIFDSDDRQIAWMFAERPPGEAERDDWRDLVASLEARSGAGAMIRRALSALCLLAVWPLLDADIARSQTPRIVSVGGAVTEIIYALGLSDRIVAVDSTSRFPSEAKEKPNVGYMRRLAPEPILALEPTPVAGRGGCGSAAGVRPAEGSRRTDRHGVGQTFAGRCA